MMSNKCLICGILINKHNSKYCSKEHYWLSLRGKPSNNKGKKLTFVIWNKGLTKYTDERIKTYSNKAIGRKLSAKHRKNISLAKIGKPTNRSWNKGKKTPEDVKIKISESEKGKKLSLQTRIAISQTRLRKKIRHSEETKKKLSLIQTKKDKFEGFKIPERIRIRHSTEYKEWRLQVFGRDDFTCRRCGVRGVYLEAHHVKGFAEFPKLRFDVDNGLTLCKECHIIIDNKRRRFKK